MQRQGSRIALVLLLTLIGAFWVHRVYIDRPSQHGFASSDMSRYFYPTAVFMHRELRSGNLPLWNPYQMAGMPFLAALHQSPLYPPQMAALISLRPARALEFLAVVHLAIAAAFSWAFARRLGLSAPAAFAAAVVYALSYALLRTLYNNQLLFTCSWLPGMLWAIHGLVDTARLRWSLALGAIGALAFLSGYSQGLLLELQLAAAYGAARWVFVARDRRLPCLGYAAVSGLLAAGLVAVQLLPSLELLGEVPRAIERLSVAEATQIQPSVPDVVRGLIGEGKRPFATPLLAVPLLAAGIASSRRRHWLFFAAGMLASGAFAVGTNSFVFELYHALPGGNLFRYPARISFVYLFCWSVLIGIGIDGARALAARAAARVGSSNTPRAAAIFALVLVAVVTIDVYSRSRLPFALPILSGETRGASEEWVAQLDAHRDDGRVFVEHFNSHYAHQLPKLIGLMNQAFVVPTYEPMIPRAYAKWFGQGAHWRGFVSTVPHRGFKRRFLHVATPDTLPPGALLRLLDALGVRYYATERSFARDRIGELETFVGARSQQSGPAYWIEREAALPRAYAVRDVVVEADPERAMRLLHTSDFDLRRRVIVDRPIDGLHPSGASADAVEITTYAAERVSLSASCASPCLVVLTDLDFPGWHAELDGQPTPIVRVNELFRGVRVPAGAHEIAYQYRSRPFRVGAAITLATLVCLVGGGIAWRVRSRG